VPETRTELMRRIEEKKRELEEQLESAQGKAFGVKNETYEAIEKRLNDLKELMRSGTRDLSDKTTKRLKAWLG
jgi:DNA-binding transcriptional MerR regulator